jgi:hypothetical protein
MAPLMDLALRNHPVETAADAAAAAAFAAATAFSASALFGPVAVPAAVLAFVPVFVILRQHPGTVETYALPAFQPVNLPNCEQQLEELLLTTEMMLDSPVAEPAEELLLDDVLARLGPDSRVVRLFDSEKMPTAGELRANIDQHLRATQPVSLPPDATQALSDALAQLRRSLH